ncbi:uncharacterized protein MONOS_1677 [Monocercomonoides exilis]|uniref:uncharacterized protein n=1 Tax=Monocercomonoides exilis TaxID=2049356 RepID=UPI00355A6B15|nr:hypothetical protein MONOS_1677 [Monocercomonoides exilis]|eukprot:MONOS_1677.1-p1 / transcript=MONOS_1677.1 / gene=MONOS_1677 / organism=Monocercomonoides_exilis_PA203 / gene_product=unspecified product / transcript_product=unspecified product / location=Mono_scaffold00031:48507-52715(+) / protein_length=1402 / sequence_SO=supercontig / SO=protein_coding / is_pseudo=false
MKKNSCSMCQMTILTFFYVFLELTAASTPLVNSFSKIPLHGTPPSPRQYPILVPLPSSTVENPAFIAFGGIDGRKYYLENVLQFGINSGEWNSVEVNGITSTPKRCDFAYYTTKSDIVIWGGMGPDGFYDDMWSFNLQTKVWSEVSQSHQRPTARQGAAFAQYDKFFAIFGGRDNSQKQNDAWLFNIETHEWSQIAKTDNTQAPNVPSTRAYGNAYLSSSYIYVFGGYTSKGNQSEKVYRHPLNPNANEDNKWELMTLQKIEKSNSRTSDVNYELNEDVPRPRSSSGIAVEDKRVFIFGGEDCSVSPVQYVRETLLYDFSTTDTDKTVKWQIFPMKDEDNVSPRRDCGTTLMKIKKGENIITKVFAFGGIRDGSVLGDLVSLTVPSKNEYVFSEKVYFNSSKENSVQSETIESPNEYGAIGEYVQETVPVPSIPNPRAHHRALAALGRMWVFGGTGEGGVLFNDLFSFDLTDPDPVSKGTWLEHSYVGDVSPPAKSNFVFVEHSGRLFIFGGKGIDPITGKQTSTNDLWEYSILAKQWKQIKPKTNLRPPLCYDSAGILLHKHIYIFGGRKDNMDVINELWSFSLVSLEWKKHKYMPQLTNSVPKPITEKTLQDYVMNERRNDRNNSNSAQKNEEKRIRGTGKQSNDSLNTIFSNGKESNEEQASSRASIWSLSPSEQRRYRKYPGLADIDGIDMTEHPSRHSQFAQTGKDSSIQRSLGNLSSDSYEPLPRESATLYPTTYTHNGVERDLVIIAGGVNEARESYLTLDRIILPLENDDSPDVIVLDPFNPDIEEYKNIPIYYRSYTAVAENGIVSFAGLSVDDAKDRINYWKLNDQSHIEFFYCQDKEKYPFISGGSAVYHGRKLFCFGGNIVGLKLPSENQYHNQFWVLNLNQSYFSCSPGTKNGEGELCEICDVGTFSKNFASKDCVQCNAGSYNPMKGGKAGYHCIACLQGEYNNKDGQGKCEPCDEGKYCPIGSRLQNASKPELRDVDHQPPLYESKDSWSLIITGISYGGGLLIGIIISLICVCCPSRSYLFKLDLFSDKHSNKLDPITNTAPKVLKKSRIGGFVSIIYLCFAIGAACAVIVEFCVNHLTETKSVISAVMDPSTQLNSVEVKYFRASLELKDFFGGCAAGVDDPNVATDWTDCHKDFRASTSQIIIKDADGNTKDPELKCKQTPSNNKLLRNVVDCEVQLEHKNVVLDFPKSGTFPSIFIDTKTEDAHCYAMYATLEVDTGIDYDNIHKRASLNQLLATSKTGKPFKGTNSTKFIFQMIPSIFTNPRGYPTVGFQIVETKVNEGSTAEADEIFVLYGLSAEMQFIKDVNILKTNWVERQKIPAFLANIMSTMMGFMGIFGSAVMVLEVLSSMRLPCANKLKEGIFKKLRDDKDEEVMPRHQYYAPMI